MKGLVIFDSSHGNTQMIAEAISETLRETGLEIDTYYVKDTGKCKAKDYDFLVIGSPTRFGTMSFAVKGFLGRIKAREWEGKSFAAYDTENPENIERNEGSAAEKIAEKLEEKRIARLLPVHKAVVSGMKGPLYDGEIDKAGDYAKAIAAALKTVSQNR